MMWILRALWGLVLILACFSFVVPEAFASASERSGVQAFDGTVEPNQLVGYRLIGLKKGDRISAELHGVSGNLDPIVALLEAPVDLKAFKPALRSTTESAGTIGQDPRNALAILAKTWFLAWNAEADPSYDANMSIVAPHDGSFLLLVMGAPMLANSGAATEATFGIFRLVLGLNVPDGVDQDTASRGDSFAALDRGVGSPESRVQVLTGELNASRPQTSFTLNTLEAGTTLTVRVDGPPDKAPPNLQLLDFGKRTLRRSTPSGSATTLSYSFTKPAQDYRLKLSSDPESYGQYHLTLGLNAPDGLTDSPAERGYPIARPAIPVNISFKLDQLFNIVQKEERFSIAATLRLQWQDVGYAFSPASCSCNFKTFNESEFKHFLDDHHLRWPEFSIYNIRGARSSQGITIFVESNGTAYYTEKFSADLQASTMDFRKFPFDKQDFYINIDSFYPNERYKFIVNQQKTGMSNQIGAEEWEVMGYDTPVTLTSDLRPRFTFHVEMKREIIYYLLKIFLPLIIIMVVSWMTFILNDYNKRADITGGHLLLFIAFSFTLSNDLPRLGYLTFIDVILANAFLVGGLVVALNLWMKKMEVADSLTNHVLIDRLMLILYPIAYFVPWLIALLIFGVI